MSGYGTDCLPVSEWVRTTAPTAAQEPITVEEAKLQCSIAQDIVVHDQLLQSLITAAREQVEQDTGIVCHTGAHTLKLTEWPAGDFIELSGIRPVTAIGSITYVDTDGTTQTWSASNYTLKTGAVKQFVHLAYAATWPAIRGDYHGITITATAGYASVAAIPAEVKTAVKFGVKVLWLSQMEQTAEAEREQAGFDRWLALLRGGRYP